jgi:hypothetical protein
VLSLYEPGVGHRRNHASCTIRAIPVRGRAVCRVVFSDAALGRHRIVARTSSVTPDPKLGNNIAMAIVRVIR